MEKMDKLQTRLQYPVFQHILSFRGEHKPISPAICSHQPKNTQPLYNPSIHFVNMSFAVPSVSFERVGLRLAWLEAVERVVVWS